MEALANEANSVSDQEMWWSQFTDTVGTAAQAGTFVGGTKRLAALKNRLERTSKNNDLLAHITFTHMSVDYAEQLQAENADFSSIQNAWLKQLESFVQKYPNSSNAAEAMLQLALAKEFAGEDDEANQWYTKIVADFRGSPLSAKAAGAKRRLEIAGKQMKLEGRTIDGKAFDISRLQGKPVVLHYWATWCEPCKQDMKRLAELQKDFDGEFEVVGVNVDSQPEQVTQYFRSTPPKWTHLYESGGTRQPHCIGNGCFHLASDVANR